MSDFLATRQNGGLGSLVAATLLQQLHHLPIGSDSSGLFLVPLDHHQAIDNDLVRICKNLCLLLSWAICVEGQYTWCHGPSKSSSCYQDNRRHRVGDYLLVVGFLWSSPGLSFWARTARQAAQLQVPDRDDDDHGDHNKGDDHDNDGHDDSEEEEEDGDGQQDKQSSCECSEDNPNDDDSHLWGGGGIWGRIVEFVLSSGAADTCTK